MQHPHTHPTAHQFLQPEHITKVTPVRIEVKSEIRDHAPADEHRAGQHRKADPQVMFQRHERRTVAKIPTLVIHDHDFAGGEYAEVPSTRQEWEGRSVSYLWRSNHYP